MSDEIKDNNCLVNFLKKNGYEKRVIREWVITKPIETLEELQNGLMNLIRIDLTEKDKQ